MLCWLWYEFDWGVFLPVSSQKGNANAAPKGNANLNGIANAKANANVKANGKLIFSLH